MAIVISIVNTHNSFTGDTLWCRQMWRIAGKSLNPSNSGRYRAVSYYPLVISHSHGKWPIEIDGLPVYLLNMVITHGYVQ